VVFDDLSLAYHVGSYRQNKAEQRNPVDRARGQASAAIREVLPGYAPLDAARAHLGLKNVPHRIGMLSPGMVYSVVCDQQAVRLPLAAGALAASLQTGKRCVLLTPGDPAMFLRKARLAGHALEPPARLGSLAVFQLAAEADKRIFCAGAEVLLKELEQNVPERGAFLVLDHADPLFMLADPRASAEAAHTYLEWIASRQHTVLALFAPAASAPRDYLALRSIAEDFAGFAVARSTDGGGSLEIRHWFACEGASPRESFALRLHASGTVSVAPAPLAHDELPPVDTVIFVRGVLQATPGGWQEAESAFEALQAARRSEAATLVLPFAHPGDYQSLCRTVTALRAMARTSLRVVIRERRLRLRAVQALALMRLGASSVIPVELSDAGAKRMVELLHGTRFGRPYDMDGRQIEEETALLAAREPTTVSLFCESVEHLLAAADGFDVESSLVRVDGAPDAAELVSLARRAGRDLLGIARGERAWLFAFGCPSAMVPALLTRLFPAHQAAGSLDWAAEHAPERILMELEGLRQQTATPAGA
jgi:hypothetical protein